MKRFSGDNKMDFGLESVLQPPSKEGALPAIAIFISTTLPTSNWSKKKLTIIWG